MPIETIAGFDLAQVALLLIGALISSVFAFVAWLSARFFRKHDSNSESITLLVGLTEKIDSSVKRSHERLNELHQEVHEASIELKDLRERVIRIESIG